MRDSATDFAHLLLPLSCLVWQIQWQKKGKVLPRCLRQTVNRNKNHTRIIPFYTDSSQPFGGKLRRGANVGQLRREKWKSSHGTSRKVFRRHQMPLRMKSQKNRSEGRHISGKRRTRGRSTFLNYTVSCTMGKRIFVSMASVGSTHFNTFFGGDELAFL